MDQATSPNDGRENGATSGPKTPLSAVIPPLLCGTATFTSQYNLDPHALPTTQIIHAALSSGVYGFDTSPYYGPAEDLLGQALDTSLVREHFRRSDYFISTKVGRISTSTFDYSPSWVQYSVRRSLLRLKTAYIDLVFCHDVEFVSPQEVLTAVIELRKIRDETGALRYVGISGYPVPLLCQLAEMIRQETGEPLDAVMSYANYTLQNTTLDSVGGRRLPAAGVDVVLNASPLGMGLLRRNGVPVGAQGDFHPAENGLREACQRASRTCDNQGQKLESVALRFALEHWRRAGAAVGARRQQATSQNTGPDGSGGVGVSVIGVSSVEELKETMKIWVDILNGRVDPTHRQLCHTVQRIIGEWRDYTWPSPGPDYRRELPASATGKPTGEEP